MVQPLLARWISRTRCFSARAEPTGDAGDYDGAYDDAGEMDDFEEAGLSTAELSPEQLRAAKRQLMKKLGGREEE